MRCYMDGFSRRSNERQVGANWPYAGPLSPRTPAFHRSGQLSGSVAAKNSAQASIATGGASSRPFGGVNMRRMAEGSHSSASASTCRQRDPRLASRICAVSSRLCDFRSSIFCRSLYILKCSFAEQWRLCGSQNFRGSKGSAVSSAPIYFALC